MIQLNFVCNCSLLNLHTDKIDFMRDIIAFTVVVGTIIGVAFDGAVRETAIANSPLTIISYSFHNVTASLHTYKCVCYYFQVYLVEACIFPLIYVLYITVVVGLGYFRVSLWV